MKKLVSLIIAAAMAVSMFAVSALPAMAEDTVKSRTAAVIIADKVTLLVNGENKQGVTYKPNSTNANEITFVYNGEGTLTGWEDNLASLGLVEGTDFTRVQNADGSLTITFLSETAITAYNDGKVVVNALVDYGTTTTATTTTAATEEEEEEEEEETTTKESTTAKKNTSSKSPATGASSTAIAAGAVAAAGAGFAVLCAMKKKDND